MRTRFGPLSLLPLLSLACGAPPDEEVTADAARAERAVLKQLPHPVDATTCAPVDPRSLHRPGDPSAIADVLAVWLEAGAPGPTPMDLDPAKLPKPYARGALVHNFPLEHVEVGPKGIRSLSYSPTPQPTYPLVAPELADPSLLPALPKTQDPYGWADDLLKPVVVVAAKHIQLTGDIDVGAHGLLLVADTIEADDQTRLRSWVFPDWSGKNNTMAWANPVHPAQIVVVARRLSVRAPRRGVAGKLVVEALSDLEDAHTSGADTKWGVVHGHAAFLTVEPFSAASLEVSPPPLNAFSAFPAKTTIRRITPTALGRLLDHHAPFLGRRALGHADKQYKRRNLPLARSFYAFIEKLHGPASGTAAIARDRGAQIDAGLNFLGEDDDVLPQRNVGLLISDAEAAIQSLDFLELDYLVETTGQLDVAATIAQLEALKVSQDLAIEAARSDVSAAMLHIDGARAALETERHRVELLSAQYGDVFSDIQADFEAFVDKVESGDCLPDLSWWDLIVKAISAIVKIVTFNFSGLVDDLGGMFSSIEALADAAKAVKDAVVPVAEEIGDLVDQSSAMADQLDGISEELAAQLDQAKATYEDIYVPQSAEGVVWDPANPGGTDECRYPKTPYPSPFEMTQLLDELTIAKETVGVAAIALREAEERLRGAHLRLAKTEVERKQTDAFIGELTKNQAKLTAAALLPIDADVASASEQICVLGQRIVDRLVRTTYAASHGLTRLTLDVRNVGPVDGDHAVALAPRQADPFDAHVFTFDYSFYDGSHQVLKDYVGVGQLDGLKQAYTALVETLGPSQTLALPLGLATSGVSVSSLAEFKKTGVLELEIGPDSQYVAGLGPVRVQDVQVVLAGLPASVRLIPQKVDNNVYHRPGEPDLVLPLANFGFSRAASQGWILSQPSAATIAPAGNVLDLQHDRVFGLSLEGRWQIRLDDKVPANQEPAAVLAGLSGGKIYVRVFGQ